MQPNKVQSMRKADHKEEQRQRESAGHNRSRADNLAANG